LIAICPEQPGLRGNNPGINALRRRLPAAANNSVPAGILSRVATPVNSAANKESANVAVGIAPVTGQAMLRFPKIEFDAFCRLQYVGRRDQGDALNSVYDATVLPLGTVR